MNYLKKLGISFLYAFGFFIVLTLLMTMLSYFNIIKTNGITVLKIMIPIVSLFIAGFILGKNALKKGWLEGIKIGLICSLFMIIVNYLAYSYGFEIKNLLYYLILTVSSILGSMIGINMNKKNNDI